MHLKNKIKNLVVDLSAFSKPSWGVEMMGKLGGSLNSGIAYVTYFLWIKQLPFFVVKLNIEIFYELRIDEIQERVTNITIILSY